MKENVEEAIDRLEYVNRAYDYNNYYSRYDLDCIQILLSDYKRVLKENEELKNKKEKTIKKIGQFSKKAETLPYDYDYLNGVSDVIKIVEENL